MSITTYCIKINLIYELDILMFLSVLRRGDGFAVSVLDLMSFSCYSKRDVVHHHRCGLSPWIQRCHIQPILAGDRAWRVQSSTASEHVASWWRGGGCGIRKKGNVQKHRPPRPVVPTRCDIWGATFKQVVKPPPTKRANLFWNAFVYFYSTREEGGVRWLLARGHAADVI